MKTKLLALDFDGTLVDSLQVMQKSFCQFKTLHNIPNTLGDFEEFNGPPLKEIIQELKMRHHMGESIDNLLKQYNKIIDDNYTKCTPNPGAIDLLKTTKLHNIHIALVTSNSHSRVKSWLQSNNLNQFFQTITTAEDVKKGKPDPECYLRTLEITNTPPERAIAIEDSQKGAQAALSAKLKVLLLNNPIAHPSCISIHNLESAINYLSL